jgi:hypothetical protein
MKIHLRVIVPKNRDKMGYLRVEQNGRILREMRVLARGSRGPGDTRFLNNGNTPTGAFAGTRLKSNAGLPSASYGPYGRITMKPVSGDGLLAEKLFNRTGLYIHGGDLATRGPWKGGLKPTHGCLRVSNSDMLYLRQLVLENPAQRFSSAKPPEIEITVTE